MLQKSRVLSYASLAIACLFSGFLLPVRSEARAQALISNDQYQELFTSAGYSALFGAALGTAILPFLPTNSVSNLRVIAGGASIGFVAGSIMALYSLRQQQNYGLQYYPNVAPDGSGDNPWQWDLGTTNGKDLFVKMGSQF